MKLLQTKSYSCVRQRLWPLVVCLKLMNEARHVSNDDIPQATTTVLMKHFKMRWPTPVEVVLNLNSLNFIEFMPAGTRTVSGCLFFCICSKCINHDTQREAAGSLRGEK